MTSTKIIGSISFLTGLFIGITGVSFIWYRNIQKETMEIKNLLSETSQVLDEAEKLFKP